MIASNFTNLQDLITFNAGTRTDALGRIFPLGTVFDPATTRTVAAGAVDPISGFQNTTSSPVFVRDPFFTGGSIAGINDFTGRASQLNILPASRLDPNAIALLKLYPAPSANGFSNNYFQTAKGTVNRNQFDIRGDERINDRDTVFGVYSWYHSSTFTPNPLPGIADGAGLFGFAGLVDYPIWEIAGGYTHVFTPTLVNDFHVGYNHAYQNQNSNEANLTGLPEKFGIPGVPQAAGNGGLPNIGISGLASLGVSGFTPTYHTLKALQLNDGVSWSRGAHNLKTGFEIVEIGGTALQPVASRGSLTFNGQYTSIPNKNAGLTGISDMLIVPGPSSVNGANNIGGLSSFQASNFSLMDYHRRYVAAYAQDNWRATRNLTLNLGLRWDYFGPQYDLNGKYANVVFNNGGNGPGGIFYLPNKTCNYPRSATFDQLLAKDNINIQCVGNNLYTAPYTNFAPRVGFAYQVASRFVARGGYGIAYSSLSPRGTGQQLGQNYPFEYTLGFSNTNPVAPFLLGNGAPTTMENAIASLNIQDPSNVSGRGASLFGSQYNFQTPYTETANLTLQYAVTRNSTVSAGYVGEFGRHLQVENVHNSPSQIVPPGASISAFIPAPDFSPNSIYQTTNGSSSYNSLQTVYQFRDSNGDSVLANYTYGKCMQDANQFQAGLSYRAPWLPGFGIHKDYQLCGSDAMHVVHGSGTYNLPFGRGKRWLASNGVANAIVGGWIVNAIYTYQSGQPFTVGCPIRTNAFFGCNANLVPGQSLYAGPHNQTQWLNPNAFANPPVATTAGASVDVLGGTGAQARGPGYSNLDTSLFKQFPLHESFRLEFRAEAFNAFNTAQFANPSNLDFTDKTKFSQITGLRGNARVLQLALKLFY